MPGATPPVMPEAYPIVATAGLMLLHVPPGVASERVIELFAQTVKPPELLVIATGVVFTVSGEVA